MSLIKFTVAVPQASVAVAVASQPALSAALSGLAHSSIRSAVGQVTTGGLVSTIEIVFEQVVLLFWQASKAWKLTVCAPVLPQPSLKASPW